ncbi:MAG: hypothetical protein WDW36_008115 [Sanguina aurantia]
MSALCAASPITKRRFEEGFDGCGELHSSFSPSGSNVKRTRFSAGHSGAWRGPSQPSCASARASYLGTLVSLFPGMEEQVLAQVLTQCGDDIDAAIKRLGELNLTAHATAAGVHGMAEPGSIDEGPSHPQLESLSSLDPQQQTQAAASAAAAAGFSSASPQCESSSPPSPAPQTGPQTGEQWVECLVQQMSTSSDMADARGKAALILQQFEGFVCSRVKEESLLVSSFRRALHAPTPTPHNAVVQLPSKPFTTVSLRVLLGQDKAAAAKAGALQKENLILKRAVQIQNSKLQERAATEAEMLQLRHMTAAFQEQVKQLELSNYSLALHLQKATTSSYGSTQHRNPDVF